MTIIDTSITASQEAVNYIDKLLKEANAGTNPVIVLCLVAAYQRAITENNYWVSCKPVVDGGEG